MAEDIFRLSGAFEPGVTWNLCVGGFVQSQHVITPNVAESRWFAVYSLLANILRMFVSVEKAVGF